MVKEDPICMDVEREQASSFSFSSEYEGWWSIVAVATSEKCFVI
jgi:hypothetical protein